MALILVILLRKYFPPKFSIGDTDKILWRKIRDEVLLFERATMSGSRDFVDR